MTNGLHGQHHAGRGQLAVRTTRSDLSAAELNARGILDAATAAVLSSVIDGHVIYGRRFLRMNVSQLRIADPEGLAVLVDAHRRLLAERGTLILTGVPDTLRTLIESTRPADELFLIAPTAEEITTHRSANAYA